MDTTATIILSAVGGAIVGYAIAKLTTGAICSSHLIRVDPARTSDDLGEAHVCTGMGHTIRWESTNGANITVAIVRMENPATAPHPYNLSCSNFVKNFCDSGPLVPNSVKGSKAHYELKIQGVNRTFNGRIIIDK